MFALFSIFLCLQTIFTYGIMNSCCGSDDVAIMNVGTNRMSLAAEKGALSGFSDDNEEPSKQLLDDDSDIGALNKYDVDSVERYRKKKRASKRYLLRNHKQPLGSSGMKNNRRRRTLEKCLFCPQKFDNTNGKTMLSQYVCSSCLEHEKTFIAGLEAFLLERYERLKFDGMTRSDPHHECLYCSRKNVQNNASAKKNDVERIQNCWQELRQTIRQMYRDGLDKNFVSLKGRQFNVQRFKRNVSMLFERDPHQLYKRLESVGYEYVMNLKSDNLWQILVAPEAFPGLIKLYESKAEGNLLEVERAKLFIKSLLDRFSMQQETVKNMSSILSDLDKRYLSLFGINWKIVNHYIFDRIIYQDDLLINYLPVMEKVLKCRLIVDETESDNVSGHSDSDPSANNMPPGALELVQSFRVFHNLMVTSREIFSKANVNFALYVEEHILMYRLAHKIKSEILKGNFDFFKINDSDLFLNYQFRLCERICKLISSQRDMNHYIDTNKRCDFGTEKDTNFSKRFHGIIEGHRVISACTDHAHDSNLCTDCEICMLNHFSFSRWQSLLDRTDRFFGDDTTERKEIAWGDWHVPCCFCTDSCFDEQLMRAVDGARLASSFHNEDLFNVGINISDDRALIAAMKSESSDVSNDNGSDDDSTKSKLMNNIMLNHRSPKRYLKATNKVAEQWKASCGKSGSCSNDDEAELVYLKSNEAHRDIHSELDSSLSSTQQDKCEIKVSNESQTRFKARCTQRASLVKGSCRNSESSISGDGAQESDCHESNLKSRDHTASHIIPNAETVLKFNPWDDFDRCVLEYIKMFSKVPFEQKDMARWKAAYHISMKSDSLAYHFPLCNPVNCDMSAYPPENSDLERTDCDSEGIKKRKIDSEAIDQQFIQQVSSSVNISDVRNGISNDMQKLKPDFKRCVNTRDELPENEILEKCGDTICKKLECDELWADTAKCMNSHCKVHNDHLDRNIESTENLFLQDDDDDDCEFDEWSDCDSAADLNQSDRHHSCDNERSGRRQNRGHHCDCCYCEVFGQSNAEPVKMGRVPQIRERLRMKLKKRGEEGSKNKQPSEAGVKDNCPEKDVNGTSIGLIKSDSKNISVASIDEIVEYINEKDSRAAKMAANKAAKRVRQKQRKQEEKERLEREKREIEERQKVIETENLRKMQELYISQEAANKQKAQELEEKRKKLAEERVLAVQRKKENRRASRHQQQKELNASKTSPNGNSKLSKECKVELATDVKCTNMQKKRNAKQRSTDEEDTDARITVFDDSINKFADQIERSSRNDITTLCEFSRSSDSVTKVQNTCFVKEPNMANHLCVSRTLGKSAAIKAPWTSNTVPLQLNDTSTVKVLPTEESCALVPEIDLRGERFSPINSSSFGAEHHLLQKPYAREDFAATNNTTSFAIYQPISIWQDVNLSGSGPSVCPPSLNASNTMLINPPGFYDFNRKVPFLPTSDIPQPLLHSQDWLIANSSAVSQTSLGLAERCGYSEQNSAVNNSLRQLNNPHVNNFAANAYPINQYRAPMVNNLQKRAASTPAEQLAIYYSETRNLAAECDAYLQTMIGLPPSISTTVAPQLPLPNYTYSSFNAINSACNSDHSYPRGPPGMPLFEYATNVDTCKRESWGTDSTSYRCLFKELPTLEPENEADAVFHFQPLV